MTRTTLKELKSMVRLGIAIDIRPLAHDDPRIQEIKKEAGCFDHIAYSAGVYGCTAQLLQGRENGQLYVQGPFGPFC